MTDYYTEEMTLKNLNRLGQEEPSWSLIESLKKDHRRGARVLAHKLEKRLKIEAEKKQHVEKLFAYQKALANKHHADIVAGIDEAGRGPLAGPVVSAVVITPVLQKFNFQMLDDSKALTEQERLQVYDQIIHQVPGYSIGMASPKEIDTLNIHYAVGLSIMRAVYKLECSYDLVLIDGNFIPNELLQSSIMSQAIPKGDSKVASIAAASILAKVTRDRIMERIHEKYPQYQFARNKGYGTKDHCQAIQSCGLSPVHRRSFTKSILGRLK